VAAIRTPTQTNIKVSMGLSHEEEALFFWLGTIPMEIIILQIMYILTFCKRKKPCDSSWGCLLAS